MKVDKKIAIKIQCCADDDPSITAECMPETSGGECSCGSTTSHGLIRHFSAVAITTDYAFHTFYISTTELNNYELHITVTPNLEHHVEVSIGALVDDSM